MVDVVHKPKFSANKHSGVVAATQNSLEQKLAVIANNLSNAETPGFKSGKVRFKEIIHQAPDGQKVSYVKVDTVMYDFSQGGLKPTHIKTHFALNGRGFFKIRTPKGDFFTRNGEFQFSNDGRLTTGQGYDVLSEANEPIRFPTGAKILSVDDKGTLYADGTPFSRFGIVDFKNYNKMKREGDSLYSTKEDPQPFEGTIQQGVLEASNVSSMYEIVQLTFTHRQFEAAQKMLDEYDRTIKRTVSSSSKNV